MKKLRLILILIFISVFCGILTSCSNSNPTADKALKTTLLDQIKARGEIRAAYIPWVPMAIKDPNTGKVSGVFPEILEEAAARAGLKVKWTEQVEYGTAIEGLKTGRYDMLGTGIWPNANRALQTSFTIPLCYSAIEVFARTNESRIKNISDIDNEAFTIATIDGEMADFIAQADFPKAKRSSLPQMSDTAQLYLQVVHGKADVVLHDLVEATNFMSANPGKIKRLFPGQPLRVFGNAYMLPQGEVTFKEFLDITLEELHNTGFVQKTLAKYNMDKVSYPVSLPYVQK